MAVKLTRLTHTIALQLHLMAESCTICSSRSRRPVRKLLDTHSYTFYFFLLNHLFATGWTIGVLGFDSRQRLGIFLFTTVSRTALEPIQLPIQWVPVALSLGVKRLGREADHSTPSSAEIKNVWSYTSISPIRLHGVVLS
jgi:hypothetical protein